jgi:hypothetical protein
MTRFTKYSPTTQPLPAPVKFGPRVSGLLPIGTMPITPMPEAPTAPGAYIVKLAGAYRPSVMAYTGPQAAERMEADHRAGVAFYCRYTGGK